MPGLRAPFPWFGGKSRAAHLVWGRFGDVPNYVEPFFGSGAVLLARPTAPGTETVNDRDAYLANFWRALKHDPQAVAEYADWPVNEADLTARHHWLVNQVGFRERMMRDPDYYDVKIAGWWVWGIGQWIGAEWCELKERVYRKQPDLGAARGVHRKRLDLRHRGKSVHGQQVGRRMHLGRGEGVHNLTAYRDGLIAWFTALADRLRRVRVCCGDWKRVLGPTPTVFNGITGVFLDPPYGDERAYTCYNLHDRSVAGEVAEWAREHGDDKRMRIAVCGYEGEHEFPDDWECLAWKAGGGYGSRNPDNRNRFRERIWFSPHCRRPEPSLWPDALMPDAWKKEKRTKRLRAARSSRRIVPSAGGS